MLKKMLIGIVGLMLVGFGCSASTGVSNPPNGQGGEATVKDISVGETFVLKGFDPKKPIESPLVIHGEALGNMYFEASFPVSVLDADQHVIGQGHAEAQGDWMSPSFVPFTATVAFSKQPSGSTGFLKLENDNPSGMPENEISGIVPVTFK